MRPRRPFLLALPLAFAVAAPAALAQDVGVPACDNFLKTYDTCIASKVPAAQQGQLRSTFDSVKTNWKAVAATPDGKKQLEAVCKQTADTLKQQLAALNCQW